MSPIEIRKKAHEFATQTIDSQRDQFLTMGILGDWANPYTTLKSQFEANEVQINMEYINM
jgi:isoleucyl-tRNA synthetase